MLLTCEHIHKDFGDRCILSDASFHINDGEKCALIGVNGVGKTTFLRMIVGEEKADNGSINTAGDCTIGYLPQQLGYHSDQTIYDELYAVRKDLIEQEQRIQVLENSMKDMKEDGAEMKALLEEYHRLQTDFENKDGYAYKSRVIGVIRGLGFDAASEHQVINTLSGGQKTRVALGKLLLQGPSLLILDEPTNHLDIASIQWLEGYLSSYPGSVLIVSHDRYFIDRFTDHIWELENGILRSYPGNYTDYTHQKDILKKSLLHSYEKQQAEIKHQEEVIRKLKSFNREKSIRRAESREKMLNKIERIDKPSDSTPEMRLSLEPAITSGNDVLSITDISKRYDTKVLFESTSFEIKRGERVAIVGDNGTGKTTLLRMINGDTDLDTGAITLGTGVELGYYDQEHGILHDDKTVFDEIHDDYPTLDNTTIRNTLAAFLFTADDVYKPISMLSGGEKGRVSLAKLMLSEANFLLLDEPTNHLDMISRQILEDALNRYKGTVLYVSHDRYFIDRTATRILDLENRSFHDYKGNYSYYLEKRVPVDAKAETQKNETGSSKADWLADKEKQAKKRRLERELTEAEKRIEVLEQEIEKIDEELNDPQVGTDLVRLTELTNKRNELDTELEQAMTTWEALGEQVLQ